MDDGQDLCTKTSSSLHVASHVTMFNEFVKHKGLATGAEAHKQRQTSHHTSY